jgi:hypothetical protein
MQRGKWRGMAALVTASGLLALAGSPAGADAPSKVRPCKPLKTSEITAAFGVEAGKGTAQGSDCTWQIGENTLSLEIVTRDAKSTFAALRDLAQDAGSQTQRVTRLGDAAVFAPIESFKQLLVLEGKKLLFIRVFDIVSPLEVEAARTALVEVAAKAVKRV